MFTAKDLNNEFDLFADKLLIPNGFNKSRLHYFKKTDTEYFAVIKDTNRGTFMDYYLCYCHYSASKQFELLSKKPSVMLKDYPISTTIDDLDIIFNNCDLLTNSSYYFYSLSRQFKVDKNCIENISDWNKYFEFIASRNESLTKSKEFIKEYIQGQFSTIEKFGFRFFNECSVDVCYLTMLRAINDSKMPQYSTFYQDYFNSFNEYYDKNKILKPTLNLKKQKSWFSKIFTRN